MNKSFAVLTSAICALFVPGSSASAAPLRQPLKNWVVDWGDTVCTASLAYGSEKAPIMLALRPSPNGTVVRLLVTRSGRAMSAHHFPVTTSITSEQEKTTGLRFGSSKKKSEIIWISFNRSSLEALKGAGEIAVTAKGIVDERFALPGMSAVLKALDECNQDLRVHWNVGAAADTQLTKKATSLKPLPSHFSEADYPHQAVQENASGATRVMMMIDETGAMKDCMVEETSGIATLDAMTCSVLQQRAKFNPALDSAEKPTRSVLTSTIKWMMPQ
jgi:hypothetical protein